MKRFLWGVEGVRLAGSEEERFVGGVLDLDGSLSMVEWAEVRSGDRLGGVDCGMVVSNNSDRRRVEKVRFASSAAGEQNQFSMLAKDYRALLTFLEMELPMRSPFLGFRWCRRRCIVV